jgi:hypothetical protein|tara:strand:+ start:128 stop:625 length:498 start_codon:yes stop_codon:yes gene_type:complete
MTNYADLRWEIVVGWNSDKKYTNQHLIDMASDIGVEIRNHSADRKSIVAKVVDAVIKSGVESGEYNVTSWGTDSENDTNFKNYMGVVEIPEQTLKLNVDSDSHEHEDGIVHSHPHDGEHTHDEDLPDFKKMTKKALDDWALEKGIELDRRKTKANMLQELKSKLN